MNAFDSPHLIYAELFEAVQSSHLLDDSKAFIDALPKFDSTEILEDYMQQREKSDFDLASFIEAKFEIPLDETSSSTATTQVSVRDHIENMWQQLQRSADQKQATSSLIALPYPYIVPGGRFREIYYWDTYFTMLGLVRSGRINLVENMVDNFAFLIDQVGFIPNGNRTYFCSRSQPPFFALMVELLAEVTGNDKQLYTHYLPQLRKEYDFWMRDADTLSRNGQASKRVIKVGDGYLNRYWDDCPEPRPEGYTEDMSIALASERNSEQVYRDIRAGAESGWDFSGRWFADGMNMSSIQTTQVIPVDLNCLLYRLESLLSEAYQYAEEFEEQKRFEARAESRKHLLQSRFFNSDSGFFCDLQLPSLSPSPTLSLAGVYPLFFGIATDDQASRVASKLDSDFLREGGWVNSLNHTGQQWDAPNGWAPSHWIAYRGLCLHGYQKQAENGASRWVKNNLKVYQQTGMLMEKYNVERPGELAAGGEYKVQAGFGWTNGVLLALMDELGIDSD